MPLQFLRRLRHAFAAESSPPPVSRRGFLAGAGGFALGAALLTPDEAWAEAETRARRFGITPGTVVDAQGRVVTPRAFGADPFIGEITLFAGNYAPNGYALCQGQVLSISQYSPLYALIGTTYGGDGRTTFALPDLRGRFPMQQGQGYGLSNYSLGHRGGTETVTLTPSQIPSHTHALPEVQVRGAGTPQLGLASGGARGTTATGPAGSTTPHTNMPPYLALNFIIAIEGIWPARP